MVSGKMDGYHRRYGKSSFRVQHGEWMGLSRPSLNQEMIDRVVIINDHSTAVGGAEVIALTSALWLNGRNLPITVLAGDAGHNAKLSAEGIDVVGMGQRPII
jgi:hypothetical protein